MLGEFFLIFFPLYYPDILSDLLSYKQTPHV